MNKKLLSVLLAFCVFISCLYSYPFSAFAADTDPDGMSAEVAAEPSKAGHGLAESCEDGNILHCFNWTLDQIKQELPDIAEAGFTSVQTSPLQGHDGNYQWYWLYQPTNFSIGNELGSYDDLKALCSEADKYGIKIIVDVVANHLAGSKNGSWSSRIDSSLRKSEYFHNAGPYSEDDDRYGITHNNIGMPDLNSENADIQNMVFAMLSSLKSAGVDGIRWDAAKHIGLPSEDCAFWEMVASSGLYNYGEILGSPNGDGKIERDDALIAEYAEYIGVTDESYSAAIMTAIRDGRVAKSSGNWLNRGVAADRIVYWGESHDTYGNNGWTNSLDQNAVDRAYALVASRADSQALYLSRPFEKNHTSIAYGKKGSTHFTSKEVAAVNHFHNAMIGTEEKYSTSYGCFAVCRGGGAVIVSPKGSDIDITVNNAGGTVPSGTYTDEVSGSQWTVTAKTMTGHIGDSGIAVIYDVDKIGKYIYIGDADKDGEVTILDATAIQRTLASLPTDAFDETAAEADGDGELSILDATAVQRWLAGLSAPDRISKKL